MVEDDISLDELFEITSKPLAHLEKFFATDATGTLLNTVTAIDVNVYEGEDNIIFREHVKRTAKNFKIEEHSGDSKYLCKENCDAVEAVDGMPFFRPKSNTLVKSDGSYAWLRMMLNYYNHPIKAKRSYNRRLNVESTNHAKKSKFGSHVRSKKDIAKENESKFQWLGYNFTVLSRAHYRYDVNPYFVR